MGFAGRIPGLQREKAPGPLTRLVPCRPQGAEGESAGQRSPQLTWAPGGARPARLGQASAPPSGARLLTAAEAPMGRAAGPRPLSQRSRHAWWGLRFPWQQHGLKFVQSLEGRSERALLWDGLLRGRGGAQGGAAPKTRRKPHPKRENVQSPAEPSATLGGRWLPTCGQLPRLGPVCPCLPATTVCKRGRPASLGGPCPPAPRGRPPRRPHICPQTSLPSSPDALTPTLLIWLKMRGRGRKTPAVKRKRGSLHERARLLHGELWKTVFYYTNHSSPPLSLNSGGCEAAALSQALLRLGHTLPY